MAKIAKVTSSTQLKIVEIETIFHVLFERVRLRAGQLQVGEFEFEGKMWEENISVMRKVICS